ncbi:MAG: undecaprenyl-diphosphate phosphatase [Eubacterium sp.]
MSVLTAVFQAIFQTICWILPISESAHSSVFHDFSNRLSGECSSLTGIVHIGIAFGIILALGRMFLTLTKEFIGSVTDLVKRNTSSNPRPARSFMLMSLISFLPMIVLLVPTGNGNTLYSLLRTSQHNGTLLDDGIFLALTGVLVLLVTRCLSLARNNKNITVASAVAVGVASIFLISVSGLSLVLGVIAILMLMGVSKKLSYRYAMVLSVPVLTVMGISEIVTSVTKINVVSAIIGAVISVAVSYFLTNALRALINKNNIKYFGYYDISLGAIIAVVGIFELILR